MNREDTIAAIATGTGGAIAIIRLSGDKALSIIDRIFRGVSKKPLKEARGFTIHYGHILDGATALDDVLVSIFHAPHSYTGEEMVEISCHASRYIQQEILRLCVREGARIATAGEFTLRAFLNGKFDLSQAEAVADIIAADSKTALDIAANQLRGGYSDEFTLLRGKLLEMTALLELELDFSEEEVEFADRAQLLSLVEEITHKIQSLEESFQLGNIIKNGVPVAIVGAPNAGKSTLLNAILKEEKALVSEIAGTTRDVIEDTINLNGITFRFIDTAGIRKTNDRLENMGIERTLAQIGRASIILLLADIRDDINTIRSQVDQVDSIAANNQQICLLLNKADIVTSEEAEKKQSLLESPTLPVFVVSAKQKQNIELIINFLSNKIDLEQLASGDPVVFNARHHEILKHAHESIGRAREGVESGLSNDLLAQDIRETLHHLGLITGEITTDDVLGTIFSKFCIGK